LIFTVITDNFTKYCDISNILATPKSSLEIKFMMPKKIIATPQLSSRSMVSRFPSIPTKAIAGALLTIVAAVIIPILKKNEEKFLIVLALTFYLRILMQAHKNDQITEKIRHPVDTIQDSTKSTVDRIEAGKDLLKIFNNNSRETCEYAVWLSVFSRFVSLREALGSCQDEFMEHQCIKKQMSSTLIAATSIDIYSLPKTINVTAINNKPVIMEDPQLNPSRYSVWDTYKFDYREYNVKEQSRKDVSFVLFGQLPFNDRIDFKKQKEPLIIVICPLESEKNGYLKLLKDAGYIIIKDKKTSNDSTIYAGCGVYSSQYILFAALGSNRNKALSVLKTLHENMNSEAHALDILSLFPTATQSETKPKMIDILQHHGARGG